MGLHYWSGLLNVNAGTIRPNRCLPLWQAHNSHLRLSRGAGIVYAKHVGPTSAFPISSGIIKTSLIKGQNPLFILLIPLKPDVNVRGVVFRLSTVQRDG